VFQPMCSDKGKRLSSGGDGGERTVCGDERTKKGKGTHRQAEEAAKRAGIGIVITEEKETV